MYNTLHHHTVNNRQEMSGIHAVYTPTVPFQLDTKVWDSGTSLFLHLHLWHKNISDWDYFCSYTNE